MGACSEVEGAELTFLLIPSLSVPAKTQGLVEGVAHLVRCLPSVQAFLGSLPSPE